uniref:Uncharacterized protein n=1 Tax=Rhizophora mucronata TaxID=61149 RepID=A0A2P2R0V3_RHIMU
MLARQICCESSTLHSINRCSSPSPTTSSRLSVQMHPTPSPSPPQSSCWDPAKLPTS